MIETQVSRRELLVRTAGAGVVAATNTRVESPSGNVQDRPRSEPFRYCLNTSTIRGQGLSLVEEIEIAARVGYHAIEPWIREIDEFVKNGGSPAELKKRIRDLGLGVESAIGFPEWIVDDDARRAKGIEEVKRNMDLVQQIGGKRLAAPPAGATDQAGLNLLKAADRYRVILELGDKFAVVPQVEVWGFSKSLGRLGEAVLVAIESGHPSACVLADVYHLYKGGSEVTGLTLLRGTALHVIHLNDYPAKPARDQITDADRVYPGDGVAPLDTIFRNLREIGFNGVLSLELFNRDYWKQDALAVAQIGLEKMRAAVQKSLG